MAGSYTDQQGILLETKDTYMYSKDKGYHPGYRGRPSLYRHRR